MKIYVVTARCGTDMEKPIVFTSKKEAEKCAKQYIDGAVREFYSNEGGNYNARKSTLQKWAKKNSYCYDDYFFWNGGFSAYETDVTEFNLEKEKKHGVS